MTASTAKQAALVTGASRGIGLGIASALAQRGFDVALNDLESAPTLGEAVEKVQALGANAVAVPGDVSDLSGHDDMLARAEVVLGPLSTLVNNAGVSVLERGDVLDVSEASYDRCLTVNAKAAFFLTQAFSRRLVARVRDDGRFYSIVSISSANAEAVSLNRAEYCVSKAASAMMSKVFATRLGPENIAVYDVRPGVIETDMTARVVETYRQLAAEGLTLFPRTGHPEDIGGIVATLASGGLPYTTGQVIDADAGLNVSRF